MLESIKIQPTLLPVEAAKVQAQVAFTPTQKKKGAAKHPSLGCFWISWIF
jgi:hypothetical protein